MKKNMKRTTSFWDVILRLYSDLTDQQFQQLRKKSRNFLVRNEYLFKRRGKRSVPPRRVVALPAQRQEILQRRSWTSSAQGMYDHISRRYQWKGMYEDVVKYVKVCEGCQRRGRIPYEESLHPA